MLYCRDIRAVLVFYCCLNEVTFSLCYIIIFQIRINNRLSNKYHRRWCALAVCFHWVGHSGMTSVQFSPLACSALWLLAYRTNGSVLRFTDTINLGVTVIIHGNSRYITNCCWRGFWCTCSSRTFCCSHHLLDKVSTNKLFVLGKKPTYCFLKILMKNRKFNNPYFLDRNLFQVPIVSSAHECKIHLWTMVRCVS